MDDSDKTNQTASVTLEAQEFVIVNDCGNLLWKLTNYEVLTSKEANSEPHATHASLVVKMHYNVRKWNFSA